MKTLVGGTIFCQVSIVSPRPLTIKVPPAVLSAVSVCLRCYHKSDGGDTATVLSLRVYLMCEQGEQLPDFGEGGSTVGNCTTRRLKEIEQDRRYWTKHACRPCTKVAHKRTADCGECSVWAILIALANIETAHTGHYNPRWAELQD